MNDEELQFKVRMVHGVTIVSSHYDLPQPPDPKQPAHLDNFCWCRGDPRAPHDYSLGVCVAASRLLNSFGRAQDGPMHRKLLQGLLQAYGDLSRRHTALAIRCIELEGDGK